MGNEQGKNKKNKFNPKHMDPNKLNIVIKQIYFTAQLYKDRRKGQQSVREKELLNLFREPANRRNRDNEYQKAAAVVNDIKWVKAFEYVMRYTDVLKDNEMVIQMSKGDTSRISELIPYVESVIYGCQKCGVECVKAFQDFLCHVFGPEVLAQLSTFTKVTPELKDCFTPILPSEREVKSYLIDLCNRNGLTLESMNEIGHGLSVSALADFPDPNSKPPSLPPTNPSNQAPYAQGQGQGQPFHQGNFPQGGYAPNNFNQPGGFPNGNHPQNSQPQGGYPQGGYPQGGYPQGGFGQGGFPQDNRQEGFPQGGYGYPQGGFPQDNSAQGGFPQGGLAVSGNYPGVAYPQFDNYPPNNFNANVLEQYKQAPKIDFQAPSNMNFGVNSRQSVAGGQQPQGGQADPGLGGAYPNFPKFGNDVPAGKFGSGDPLDELDMRLKNIKNGL